MLTALLEGETNPNPMGNLIPLIILVVFIAVLFVFYFISSKKRKKQEQDAKNLIDAVGPGNKVKTIGGICGIVVEVDDEENTFVLETGTETSGKSYIKFDKQAIYQTDAVVENKEAEDSAAQTSEEVKPEQQDNVSEAELSEEKTEKE